MNKERTMKRTKFPNEYNIKQIKLKRTIKPFCPIGKSDYKAKVVIFFTPGKWIPEYIQLTDMLDFFNGSNLTIEELAALIKETLEIEYKPEDLHVAVKAKSKKHCPVTIIA